MFLLGQRVRGRSIQNPLGEGVLIPNQLEPKILEQLVERLRNKMASLGDKRQIYEGHMRLAISIAARYANKTHIQRSSDLVSESLLTIGILIDSIEKGDKTLTDNNFTPWCAVKIHSALSNFIDRDRIIRVPHTTFLKKRDELPNVKVISIPIEDSSLEEQDDYNRKRRGSRRLRSIEVRNHVKMIEIRELITKSVRTDEENTVIKLRTQGLNDIEIAKRLGMSKSKVSVLRGRVITRFQKLDSQ